MVDRGAFGNVGSGFLCFGEVVDGKDWKGKIL